MNTLFFILGVIVGAVGAGYILLYKNPNDAQTTKENLKASAEKAGNNISKAAGKLSSSVAAGVYEIREERERRQIYRAEAAERQRERDRAQSFQSLDPKEWEETDESLSPEEWEETGGSPAFPGREMNNHASGPKEWERIRDDTDKEEWVLDRDKTVDVGSVPDSGDTTRSPWAPERW